jgi:hypothetical protein
MASGVMKSPNHMKDESFAALAEAIGVDPKRSFYILGSREAADYAYEAEGLKTHNLKITEPFALVKQHDKTDADRRDKKNFDKMRERLGRFDQRLSEEPFYTLSFPRVFALNDELLEYALPQNALDIQTARLICEAGIYLACKDALPSQAVIPLIPERIDFAYCRRLEVWETSSDILLRLCDDTKDHNTLYQTPVSKQAWHENKDYLLDKSAVAMRVALKHAAPL